MVRKKYNILQDKVAVRKGKKPEEKEGEEKCKCTSGWRDKHVHKVIIVVQMINSILFH